MQIELYSLFGVSFLLTGAMSAVCAYLLIEIFFLERVDVFQLTQHSRERILKLRTSSLLYWAFEPILESLATVPLIRKLARYDQLDKWVVGSQNTCKEMEPR